MVVGSDFYRRVVTSTKEGVENASGGDFCSRIATTCYLNSDAAATEHDDIPCTKPSTEHDGIPYTAPTEPKASPYIKQSNTAVTEPDSHPLRRPTRRSDISREMHVTPSVNQIQTGDGKTGKIDLFPDRPFHILYLSNV